MLFKILLSLMDLIHLFIERMDTRFLVDDSVGVMDHVISGYHISDSYFLVCLAGSVYHATESDINNLQLNYAKHLYCWAFQTEGAWKTTPIDTKPILECAKVVDE
ncbi:hypothetical protein VNO78_15343 [Psophocarpus tetragonolobus]|uniref:Uncharacterized protein n=1 Tax=Psophocarpus tetragonolobus TaxID=3891 RepID=A0AAN9SFX0_PSOTE